MSNREKKVMGELVMTAGEAKGLIRDEQLPENWLGIVLTRIDHDIRFQAESKSNRTMIWECEIKYEDEEKKSVIVSIKDVDKLDIVRFILESRGYKVNLSPHYSNGTWSMDITW